MAAPPTPGKYAKKSQVMGYNSHSIQPKSEGSTNRRVEGRVTQSGLISAYLAQLL